jgi:FkbM family methyltransferase
MRRRNRDLDPASRQLLETQSYAKAMFDFMAAAGANPGLLTDLPIDQDCIAVDLGAYRGDWTSEIVDRYRCAVYAFEPNPALLTTLVDRFQNNNDVTVLGYGLGAGDRTARLAKDGPGSSIHRSRGMFGQVDVSIRDVVSVFSELALQHVDVMKINIEGEEYDVLERLAEAEWLPRIATLIIQFHEWLPRAHRRRRNICDRLRETHDQMWCYPWVWELWRIREQSPH